jgi:exopolyphosphatase / guanosine-5'-triphosphate,3'-diphosphate pyrophosphatase
MSSKFFSDGEITEKRMKRARLAARLELEPVQAAFKKLGFEHAVGASGTIRAVHDVLRARPQPQSSITLEGVETLVQEAIRVGHVSRLKWPGLPDERAPVLPGGLAVLAEILSMLDVRSMRISDGALREGLLYDMLGRLTDEDARVRSVRAMQARYHVDIEQAERVESSALQFLAQVQAAWELGDPFAELVLSWAARLHEVGLDVSHSQYQKHGAYLLEHADLPGFPQEEQRILACIVGSHRRKLHEDSLEDLNPPWHLKTEFLIVLLRLAVLLHRGRSPTSLPPIRLQAKGRVLEVQFPAGWLDDHPLTAVDMEQEVAYLDTAGFRLRVS